MMMYPQLIQFRLMLGIIFSLKCHAFYRNECLFNAVTGGNRSTDQGSVTVQGSNARLYTVHGKSNSVIMLFLVGHCTLTSLFRNLEHCMSNIIGSVVYIIET